ncbi:type IX secretion system motor protein PorM/GldM [Mucilaginibacter boryungensis]|uniref:Gliding motility protein GldM n=1 Tax=Mucilaginibacter boryungensis TaxID=768480 RepID=A0ABR9XJQ4_9SPHI|nr:gliding motility protein GldM [Mucilaginibacter boryungensis]MBE9667460.1 gliding motility protein GldM [Mucilaginibacter boryungensis]
MAGGKETPRQRMIGILYLVLLGLIALNVPDSLLDSFRNITNSLNQSTNNVSTSLESTYAAFKATKLKEQPEKARMLLTRAEAASKTAAELNTYIEKLKAELTAAGGGFNPEIGDVDARDNLDISPRIMITNKKADVLRDKILETRSKLIKLLDPKDQKVANFSLNITEPVQRKGTPTKTWQEAYFGDGIPLGATLTTLAKIQADNKNAENEVVKKILGKIDQAQITLNEFVPVVAAPSSYIIQGQPYTAKIYLTAYDSHSNPTITVGGASVPTSGGVGTFTTIASGEGVHTITGNLSVKQVDGPNKNYPFTTTYTVSRPSAVVSPDKMNVFYIGVPNPVSVSAPGVPKESIRVNIEGGEISGSAGHYIVKVRSIGTSKVTVTGDKGMVLGTAMFRTKRIPPPKAVFAGKTSGSTSAANLKAQDRIFARLDGFDFDAKFNVTHFTLVVAKPRQDVIIKTASGNVLSGEMHSALNTITPGSTVVFRDITAVGPDGVQQEIDPIVFSVN